jgi:hypothetical protein
VVAAVAVLWLVVGGGSALAGAAGTETQTATATGTLNLQVQAAATAVVIRVNTLGKPPAATAASPIWLVNDAGLSLTKVWVISAGSPRCRTASVHFVPIGPAPYNANTDWCLNIRLPPYGSQVAGVLHGDRATIALTVEHQAAWGWPIFWAAFGLGVALAVVLCSSGRFTALAPGFRLHFIVWREARKRVEKYPKKILGLTMQWRRDARSAGLNLRSLAFVTSVADVVKNGAVTEDQARLRLRDALRAGSGPWAGDPDTEAEAVAEVGRSGYHISDFFDDRFQPTAVPAERLLTAGRTGRAPDGDGPVLRPDGAGRGATGRGILRDIGIVSTQFIPMIVAGGSALASVYLTNKTFGLWTDYLALALATAGSSAVAAGAAALFRVLTPASGSGAAPPAA